MNDNQKFSGTVPAIATIVLLLSFVYSMMSPLDQRVSSLEDQIAFMRATTNQNRELVVTQNEKIVENRANILAMDEKIKDLEEWRVWWGRGMLPQQTQMTEKVKNLERQIYGPATPQISGE